MFARQRGGTCHSERSPSVVGAPVSGSDGGAGPSSSTVGEIPRASSNVCAWNRDGVIHRMLATILLRLPAIPATRLPRTSSSVRRYLLAWLLQLGAESDHLHNLQPRVSRRFSTHALSKTTNSSETTNVSLLTSSITSLLTSLTVWVLCGCLPCNKRLLRLKQEAQLLQRDRTTLRVIKYFAVTQGHSRSFETTYFSAKSLLVFH